MSTRSIPTLRPHSSFHSHSQYCSSWSDHHHSQTKPRILINSVFKINTKKLFESFKWNLKEISSHAWGSKNTEYNITISLRDWNRNHICLYFVWFSFRMKFICLRFSQFVIISKLDFIKLKAKHIRSSKAISHADLCVEIWTDAESIL